MPKSSQKEIAALREEVFARDGYKCIWPIDHLLDSTNHLELVHLRHRGMGGSIERNTADNCVTMCKFHHDVYDGRTGGLTTRTEYAALMRHVAGIS